MQARPKLVIPLTSTDHIIEIVIIIGLIWLWALTLYLYPRLPDTIPIHFNLKGEVDDFGNRATAWLVPIVAPLLYILITFLNRYPHQFNYSVKINPENALRQYTLATRMIRTLKLALILVFMLLQWSWLEVARGRSMQLSQFFLPLTLMLLLAPLGYYFWQSAKNK